MNELEWLSDQRPEVRGAGRRDDGARAARAARARRQRAPRAPERRRHAPAARDAERAAPRVADRRSPPPPSRCSRSPIVVVAGALPSGDGVPGVDAAIGAPTAAEAAPLVQALAADRGSSPRRPGDATLVIRSHDFPDGEGLHRRRPLPRRRPLLLRRRPLAQLKAAGESGRSGDDDLEREAALAAIELAPDEARQRMIDATWGGKQPPADEGRAAALAADARQAQAPERAARAETDDRRQPHLVRQHGRADRRRRPQDVRAGRDEAARDDRHRQGHRPRRHARPDRQRGLLRTATRRP